MLFPYSQLHRGGHFPKTFNIHFTVNKTKIYNRITLCSRMLQLDCRTMERNLQKNCPFIKLKAIAL